MAFDKFLIAPFEDGTRKDVKPWLVPDQAFEELNNAYNFRGRIKKRIGSFNVGTSQTKAALTSRLRIKVGTTDPVTGNLSGTVPLGATIGAVGQLFSIDTDTFTVFNGAAGAQDMKKSGGTATTYTFDIGTGAYVFVAAAVNTDVYFYPSTPVMGFANYEKIEINDEHTFAFDRNFNYQLINTGWEAITPAVAAAQWSSSDSQFFWSENYRGLNDYSYILFTTNYKATDYMRYYDGAAWNVFRPTYNSGSANYTIDTARIIVSFQNRLLLLNVAEGFDGSALVNTITNRCRYSQIGSPLAADAWHEDVDGKGSFIDAPTREAIVSAAKIKNRLIVYFERSTYELVYTGNQVYPFRWQEINSQLGCESTFSIISFDKVVLGIGDSGIHACSGANVERIDSKIPDEIFKIHNDNDGVFRVCGIRDFYNEMSYWSIPSQGSDEVFPGTLLIYNYVNNTWATFDDSVTTFGYHYLEEDEAWTTSIGTWEDRNEIWNSGALESKHRYVIAGNQQGFTYIMSRDWARNAFSQQITNITEAGGVVTVTSIDHNLETGDFVHIHNAVGITELNDNIYKVKRITKDTFTIDESPAVTGTYSGSGTISLVSKIDIYTKRFNFYSGLGLNTNIEKTDFLVDKVDDGEMTVDYLASSSGLSLRDMGVNTGAILGTAILETTSYGGLEDTQERFWHAVYLQAQGESVQLRLYWDDDQMKNNDISLRWFEMNGILFHASPTQEL